jgi:membrane-bound lytic murein transglycosylase B
VERDGRWNGIRIGRALGTAAASLALGCASAGVPSVAAAPTPEPAAALEAPALAPAAELPPPAAAPSAPSLEARVAEAKGWGWLVERLAADGVDRARAERSFADPRVPPFEGLFFGVDPREPRSMYRAVLRPRSVALARACAGEYADAFQAAERATGVPAEVVAAILHVETRCGRSTGRSIVLFGVARLAMADEPANLEANLAHRVRRGGSLDPAQAERVRARAAELGELFYPEVRAVFAVADAEGVDPLELRGSGSGAFGAPQFLPTSYLRFGTDGNGDGRIDLYDVEDAAASAANYLASHGWRADLTRAERRRVIWHYNRSDAYIDAVLGLADHLRGTLRAPYPKTADAGAPSGGVPVEAAQ